MDKEFFTYSVTHYLHACTDAVRVWVYRQTAWPFAGPLHGAEYGFRHGSLAEFRYSLSLRHLRSAPNMTRVQTCS